MRLEPKAQTHDAGMGGVLRFQNLGSPSRLAHAGANPLGVAASGRSALRDVLVELLLRANPLRWSGVSRSRLPPSPGRCRTGWRRDCMSVTLKSDMKKLHASLKAVKETSRRSFTEIINKALKDVAFRAAQFTPKTKSSVVRAGLRPKLLSRIYQVI